MSFCMSSSAPCGIGQYSSVQTVFMFLSFSVLCGSVLSILLLHSDSLPNTCWYVMFFLKLLLRTLCTQYVVNCELEAGGLLSALRQSATYHSQTGLRLRITFCDCDLCCVKSHNLSTLHMLIQQITALTDTLEVSVEMSVINGSLRNYFSWSGFDVFHWCVCLCLNFFYVSVWFNM